MVPTANGMILLLGILCIVLGIYIVPDAEICAGSLCTLIGLGAVTFAVYGKYVLETPFAKVPRCIQVETSSKKAPDTEGSVVE